MKVWLIVSASGKLVSAWPKRGQANIHCRTELKDRVIERELLYTEPTCSKKAKKK